jgi:radical SAM superfamily enzyme YgiQ (UPF0313 family)
MFSLPFEQGPIRPVDEADSLLIRTTRGCPWNRCSFCSLYDTMKFSIRPVEEIKQDIWAARDYFGGHPFDTCFLQDGDSFVMRTKDLIAVLETLKSAFPTLRQISSYGRAQTMVKKSSRAIKEICDAGLNKLYCGMESGSRKVLEKIRKGITPESIIRSARMARQAGMHTTQFIILGLGGTELSEVHALETARVLNDINPDHIRVLTIGIKPGKDLDRQMKQGEWTRPSETAMIAEQRLLFEHLAGIDSHYANHHSVDLLLEIRGQLPADRQRLLDIMDRFLTLSESRQTNFIMGRRLGYYRILDDQAREPDFFFVEEQVEKALASGHGNLEDIFHNLRIQVI